MVRSRRWGRLKIPLWVHIKCMRWSVSAAGRLAVVGFCTAIWILHLHFWTPTALLTGIVWPFTASAIRVCVWWQRCVGRCRKMNAVHQTWLRDCRNQLRRCSERSLVREHFAYQPLYSFALIVYFSFQDALQAVVRRSWSNQESLQGREAFRRPRISCHR